ncbi:hypothetical protein LWF15_24385 [Kineosporia rhizophila]|uniref:hypothetical protein n=1 Tax=Kineosporia rhizophila TaxID=84633 RepID=UPI001E3F5CCF|nr:hypothetical protein [Kineosporia rhizophila]MCE0538642.1 hypothetical protein [Kineosporia rhizophila]
MTVDLSALRRPDGYTGHTRVEVALVCSRPTSVVWLELVMGGEDITVCLDGRPLAVMARLPFITWLWFGGDYRCGDLLWAVLNGRAVLSVDGQGTYELGGDALTRVASVV